MKIYSFEEDFFSGAAYEAYQPFCSHTNTTAQYDGPNLLIGRRCADMHCAEGYFCHSIKGIYAKCCLSAHSNMFFAQHLSCRSFSTS